MVCKPFGQFLAEDMVMMMSLGDEIKADPDKLKRFLWQFKETFKGVEC
jgi:hypothetical protein